MVQASLETIEEALTGNYRPEHVFALRQAVELSEFHPAKIAECDREIEVVLREVNQSRPEPPNPLPAVRHASGRNEPAFEVRKEFLTLRGDQEPFAAACLQ